MTLRRATRAMLWLAHVGTAVHLDCLTSHERRQRRGQEQGCARDVGRLTDTLDGQRLAHGLQHLRCVEAIVERCTYHAGRDAIDAISEWRELECEVPAHREHATLGGGVGERVLAGA